MTISNIFSKATEAIVAKFYVHSSGAEGTELLQLVQVTRLTWRPRQWKVKSFENLLLWNQWADASKLVMWHLALGYFQGCSNSVFGLTMTFLLQDQILENAKHKKQ